MGLFGLFYTAFGLGCKGAMGIKNSLEDSENKTKYRDNKTNTYFDHNMSRRDLTTNHRMSIETKWNGEMWLRDCETGRYVRNLTVERAEKKYQEEKAKVRMGLSDRTHIIYGNIDYHQEKIPGYRYKDFETGKIYIARDMILTKEECNMIGVHYDSKNYKHYTKLFALVDPIEKRAVRLTDRSIEYLLSKRQTDEEIKRFNDEFIDRFNKYINEPYTHFRWNMTSGFEAGNQDSVKEGNFIADIRAEMEYRYGRLLAPRTY